MNTAVQYSDPLNALIKAYTRLTLVQTAVQSNPRLRKEFEEAADKKSLADFMQVAARALNAFPYNIEVTAIEFIEQLTDKEIAECKSEVSPPFQFTWFSLEEGIATPGVMLHEKDAETISAAAFFAAPGIKPAQEARPFFLGKRTSKKLWDLRDTHALLIFPDIEYNKAKGTITIPPNFIRYTETPDFLPIATPMQTNDFSVEVIEDIQAAVATAIILSGALVKNKELFPFITDNVPPPNVNADKATISMGQAPIRRHSRIRIDLSRVRMRAPNPNSPATRIKAREPEFKQQIHKYSYSRKSDGREVHVPPHTRWNSKPDRPAQLPRKVHASQMPDALRGAS